MVLPIVCVICKETFYVRPYRKTTARCCSRKCLWHFTKNKREPNRIKALKGKKPVNFSNLEMQCKHCCKTFFISPSRIGIKFFCSQDCYTSSQRKNTKAKYKRIYVNGIRVHEHRYVMEKKIGRKLLKSEHVHHLNGNGCDNRIQNLHIVNPKKHCWITQKEKRYTK